MKIVKEAIFEKKIEELDAPIKLTAGLAIIQNGSILLGHPTGSKWYGAYSIPKGEVEKGEDLLAAAIRETREEVGLTIDPKDIEDTEPRYIDYKDKAGQVYKRVYYFIVNPSTPISSDALTPDKKEIDWAGFILKDKAAERIFWRLKPILDEMEKSEKKNLAEDEKEEKSKEGEEEFGL
jgi:ADP-ribose pyrophosphatase YjhB (NUDIX family)